MRYFPGIVFCLMGIAIWIYNSQVATVPFNIPFLDDIGLAGGITERGERTWQIMLGIGVLLLLIAGVFSFLQPRPEPLLHDETKQEPWEL